MRITEVRAVFPKSPGAPGDWRGEFGQILVIVETDAGLTGYGVGGGGAAGVRIVRSLLRDVLVGCDPLDVENHWTRLYRAVLPFGRTGLAVWALSGVDLALWDVRGKAEKASVTELLGGARRESIPAYASPLGPDPGDLVEKGYRAVKLHLPPVEEAGGRDAVAEMVSRARETVGPEVRLMADAFMLWDVEAALALAPRFAEEKVEWLEEPLPSCDLAGYERLKACPVPIAGGEHEQIAASFETLAVRGLCAILQPDVTWCGGMTELVEVYRLAREHGIRVCPHRGSEPWGLPAIAALEREDPLAEQGRPWMSWLVGAPKVENGTVSVPDRPGFGVEPDEAALSQAG